MRQLIAILVFLLSPALAHAAADATHGQLLYAQKCQACHGIGKENRVGPSMIGIAGGPVGKAQGFDYAYSTAIKTFAQNHPVWDDATLDQFLANPRETVSGTKMAFYGLMKPEDRADIIAFLKSLQ